MGQYIDYKTYNPVYAPGIGTYSAKGEIGDNGDNGISMYFNKDSIRRNAQERDFVNSKIQNNQLLTSDTDESDNTRKYDKGDLIVDSDGDVYTIVEVGGYLSLSTLPIGNIGAAIKKNYVIDSSVNPKVIRSIVFDGSGTSLNNYVYNVVYTDNIVEYGLINGSSLRNVGVKEVEVFSKDSGRTAIFSEI